MAHLNKLMSLRPHRSLYLLMIFSSIFLSNCKDKSSDLETSKNKGNKELSATTTSKNPHQQLLSQPGQNAISAKCQECHSEVHHKWHGSHHAQANRLLQSDLDTLPFTGQKFHSGNEKWSFTNNHKQPTISSNNKKHEAGMVIGKDPLIQYLVAASDGRWQAPNAAWDPHKKEWFDIFNGDKRTENDWGHFTGQGMNWNSQCAWCHMTDYDKGYDLATDTYKSTWSEMGIGCTQCHSDLLENPSHDSGCLIDIDQERKTKKEKPNIAFDNCATCHSRRTAFDDDFKAGDKYGDHYGLQLPTQAHLYYPDGQIKDEVYVWASLRTSNMGHKGVQCSDCHDPHSNELKHPVQNNMLCMSCHAGGSNGRVSGAIVIDPNNHSHHAAGTAGSSCVDCHMTHTTYMGRDDRRDHGFHVPDPLMTKELGIPNACNKCHTDKDADWSIKWTNTWYGEKMNSPERTRQRARTRAISSAYEGNPDSIEALLKAHKEEPNPYWQASLLEIMQPWGADPRVQYLGRSGVHHKESIVRASACRLMEFSPENTPWLEPMLKDPIKEVRLAAAWALRSQLTPQSSALLELTESFKFTADQPASNMRMMQLAYEAQNYPEAEKWIKRALQMDQTSPPTHEYYAILLSQMNRPQEALEQLQVASKLAPDNTNYLYQMALAYAELKQKDQTEKLLKQVIEINPSHERAFYNLSIIYAERNQLDEAIKFVSQSEQINPAIPDYPYLRATLHLRQDDKAKAFDACRTVLGINRNYQPAINLIRTIGNPNQ